MESQHGVGNGSMMKRLAITISGAVSLGSFEAGVMYEICQALKQHNGDPATAEDGKITVDVICGASAGGMTAAIAAQKLLFEAESLENPSGNAFYIPWVRSIGLAALLDLASDESSSLSILSSDVIENISKQLLMARYVHHAPPKPKQHPAVANKLIIGLAMSNLSGIDYSIPLLTGGNFVYTRFQDNYVARLSNSNGADDTFNRWESIRNAAVACGAFPFAFRLKELQRSESDYPGAAAWPPTLGRYVYTDGGLFQNEPLGLAKNLVDMLDPNHEQHDQRFYLFVAPGLRESVMDKNGSFAAAGANYVKTGARLVSAIFNQARYRDWVRVETLNRQVERLDAEAAKLASLFRDGRLASADLKIADAALLPVVYPIDEERDAALHRLQTQYSSEYNALGGGANGAEFIKAVAVLERLLGVSNYDIMKVYSISASNEELAGSALMAFAGFFDQTYRQHDYDMGRLKAQEVIAELNRNAVAAPPEAQPSLGPINYTADANALPRPNPSLNCVDLHQLSSSQRKSLKAQVQDRVNTALEELNVNYVERAAIIDLVVSSKLNDVFGL